MLRIFMNRLFNILFLLFFIQIGSNHGFCMDRPADEHVEPQRQELFRLIAAQDLAQFKQLVTQISPTALSIAFGEESAIARIFSRPRTAIVDEMGALIVEHMEITNLETEWLCSLLHESFSRKMFLMCKALLQKMAPNREEIFTTTDEFYAAFSADMPQEVLDVVIALTSAEALSGSRSSSPLIGAIHGNNIALMLSLINKLNAVQLNHRIWSDTALEIYLSKPMVDENLVKFWVAKSQVQASELLFSEKGLSASGQIALLALVDSKFLAKHIFDPNRYNRSRLVSLARYLPENHELFKAMVTRLGDDLDASMLGMEDDRLLVIRKYLSKYPAPLDKECLRKLIEKTPWQYFDEAKDDNLWEETLAPFPEVAALIAELHSPINRLKKALSSKLLINSVLKHVDYDAKAITLTLDSKNTALKLNKELALRKIAWVSSDVQKDNQLKISFGECFGESEKNKFVIFVDQILPLLTPAIKTIQPEINLRAIPNLDHEEVRREPVKRVKQDSLRRAPEAQKPNNSQGTSAKAQPNQKKKKGKNPGKKASKSKAPQSGHKPCPAPPRAAKGQAQTQAIKASIFSEPSASLSNEVPSKVCNIEYPRKGDIPPQQPQKVILLEPVKIIKLLIHANEQIGDLLKTSQESDDLFFALYSPMLVISDCLYKYFDLFNKGDDVFWLSFIEKQLLLFKNLFKNLRDEKLKDLALHHGDPQVIASFQAFVVDLHAQLKIALPVMHERAVNSQSTETCSIDWENIREKIQIFSEILLQVRGDEEPASSLENLKQDFVKLSNKSGLAGRGLIAMAGALSDGFMSNPKPKSPLCKARKLRNALAHPQGNPAELEASVAKQLSFFQEHHIQTMPW